jgi:hypothetical protein
VDLSMAMNGSISYEDLKNKNIAEIIKMLNTINKLEKQKEKIINKKVNK